MKKLLFLALLGFSLVLSADPVRILVGSPVRQKPAILKEFLESLDGLEKENFTLDYCFYEDNIIEESKELLLAFAEEKGKSCHLFFADEEEKALQYETNEVRHYWNTDTINKVGRFKNHIIAYCINKKYDYLFLIDSDLVLHPHTVEQLLEADKEIISNIFWTSNPPGATPLPQVWLRDEFVYNNKKPTEDISENELLQRQWNFFGMLKNPGIYEVGGLGACTLIQRSVLEQGVCFKQINNVSFFGEDAPFCIRATARGIPLYVDTHYPAYHIYRESELAGVPDFKKSCHPQRIILGMLVKNEADRYLRRVLESAREYIAGAVIIDDASTDNTPALCREVLEDIPLNLIVNETSQFSNEWALRQKLWREVVKMDPDWILMLDADEIFEERFKDEIQDLIKDPTVDAIGFRIFDLWDEKHYREDHFWNFHLAHHGLLIRYFPGLDDTWREKGQHCGRFPIAVSNFIMKNSDLRLKHYGWSRLEDRIAKYFRYLENDPDGTLLGSKAQYESILDATPNLVEWAE